MRKPQNIAARSTIFAIAFLTTRIVSNGNEVCNSVFTFFAYKKFRRLMSIVDGKRELVVRTRKASGTRTARAAILYPISNDGGGRLDIG
jgi:uncharacterized sodium:solute symporter family permease YidK